MRKFISVITLAITLAISSSSFAIMPQPLSESIQDMMIPKAPSLNVKSYVMMDPKTGAVIAAKNAETKSEPASLTKLMTAYLVFDAMKNKTISLDEEALISETAWKMGGSKMFVKVGDQVKIEDLLHGMITQSGNDATIALAEHIAGNEGTFVDMMNLEANRLGMENTHFENATGLPENGHETTAYDLAILSSHIIEDFPEYYDMFFKEKWFKYAGIKQPNRNRLLWRFNGTDGLKTGHTETAGYCLISSAIHDDNRFVAVVLGAPNDEARSKDSIALLNYGFRFFSTEKIADANVSLASARTWKGKESDTRLGLAKPLYVTVPVSTKKKITTNMKPKDNLTAPIKKGEACGTVEVLLNGQPIAETELVALEENPKGGFFSRAVDSISQKFSHWFHKKDNSKE